MEGKTWGQTDCLFSHHNVEIHRIEVVAGGYCSRHIHKIKFNRFFVESGLLTVRIFRDNKLTDSVDLGPGMSTVVKPGEKHQFIAKEKTVAYEIYYTVLESNDIERYSQGGVIKRKAKR